jgi:signal peptidase I
MFSLRDWTTYVFAGIVVAIALGILWYNVNFDIYKSNEPPDKQFNEPEMKPGKWRLGHLPSSGAPLEVGMMVVFQMHGTDSTPRVSRIVALEGQKVSLQNDDLVVDGQIVPKALHQGKTRFDVPETVVPHNCVFCINLNIGKAPDYDSRRLGPIPIEAITHCFKPNGGAD